LRWGITSCLILAVGLITTVFYNHPSTTSATLFFRTVPILPETMVGRVAEIYIKNGSRVEQGAPIFRLDSSKQQAAVETARRKVDEVEAALKTAKADLQKAEAQIREAKATHQQALDELETKMELYKRNPGNVPFREIEKLKVRVEGTDAGIAAAIAAAQSIELRVTSVLPAEMETAKAVLAEAMVELDKTTVRAGVSGTVEQFFLRVGDIVNPLIRSAGILIPDGAGQRSLQAGFNQIEAQIMKVGMIAEVTCVSKPFTIIPMVVTDIQNAIAAGQFRGGEQLVDTQQVQRPGTLLVFLEPLYNGGLEGVTPGSSCIANAYSNNHDIIAAEGTSTMRRVALHVVDALGLVHALILRLQALVLSFKALVFSGH